MKEFNAVAKGTISDEDLSRAKSVFVHGVVEPKIIMFCLLQEPVEDQVSDGY